MTPIYTCKICGGLPQGNEQICENCKRKGMKTENLTAGEALDQLTQGHHVFGNEGEEFEPLDLFPARQLNIAYLLECAPFRLVQKEQSQIKHSAEDMKSWHEEDKRITGAMFAPIQLEQPKQDVWGERKYPQPTSGMVHGSYIKEQAKQAKQENQIPKGAIGYGKSLLGNTYFISRESLINLIREEAKKIAWEMVLIHEKSIHHGITEEKARKIAEQCANQAFDHHWKFTPHFRPEEFTDSFRKIAREEITNIIDPVSRAEFRNGRQVTGWTKETGFGDAESPEEKAK